MNFASHEWDIKLILDQFTLRNHVEHVSFYPRKKFIRDDLHNICRTYARE